MICVWTPRDISCVFYLLSVVFFWYCALLHNGAKKHFIFLLIDLHVKCLYVLVRLCAGGLETNSQSGSKKGTSVSSADKTFTGAISSLRRHDDAWLGAEVLKCYICFPF